MKSYKQKILWSIAGLFAIAGLGIAVAPEFITLNNLKPKLEQAINSHPGINAKINGDIKFSLLSGPKLVAHNITVPNGFVKFIEFDIPIKQIFNLSDVNVFEKATVYGADLKIESLTSPLSDQVINIKSSTFEFRGHKFELVSSELNKNILSGILKTHQNNFNYYYSFVFDGVNFNVKNDKDNLIANGRILPDGSANGVLSVDTENINNFFHFSQPEIKQKISLTTNFYWDGFEGLSFEKITGENVSGNVEIYNNGRKDIEIKATDVDIDLSYLASNLDVIYNTNLKIELTGKIKFRDNVYSFVRLNTIGTGDEFIINEIILDTTKISGGTISKDFAKDLPITLVKDGADVFCFFSGNLESWECKKYQYDDMSGKIIVDGENYEVFLNSDKKMFENTGFYKRFTHLGTNGELHFNFADASGTVYIKNDTGTPKYSFAKDKPFNWLGDNFYFIPENMANEIGAFSWKDNLIFFVSNSNNWSIEMNVDTGYFKIRGANIKDWFTDADLQAIKDMDFIATGNLHKNNIYDLVLKFGNHEFKGNVIGNNIILTCDILNLDLIASQEYIDEYESMKFLTPAKITLPFDLGLNIGLKANKLIYNGDIFSNFIYSLEDNEQAFSITDESRGDFLVSVIENGFDYEILLELNRFKTYSKLLGAGLPLNIEDTTITGQANLRTSGKIAFDIWKNLSGTIDIVLEGGTLTGLGIDNFYATAGDITTLNAEYSLMKAFESGKSRLKNMRIIGEYKDETFTTTAPFTLSLNHTDITGEIKTFDGNMSVKMDFALRGTAPTPEPITLNVLPTGKREYSLSEIMTNFDAYYFKSFVATHDKFKIF